MKFKIFSIAALSGLILCAVNCASTVKPEPEKPADSVVVAPGNISVDFEAAEVTLTITANCEWGIASGDRNWVSVSPSGGVSGTSSVKVKIEKNSTRDARKTDITVRYGSGSVAVPVEQGFEELPPEPEITGPEGYSLVWNDEFNEGTVPGKDWTHEVKNSGWVNHELQNYRNGTADGRRVTEVKDGTLRINCFKGSDGKIYSGRIYGCVKTGWQYGYVEAKIKLPKGKGTWPAFWMMPVNFKSWPDDGEIDIMEEVGYHPNYVSSSLHAIGHVHSNNTQVTKEVYCAGAEGEFHVYGMEWTKDYFQFYVDGKKTLYYKNPGTGKRDWPYDAPFYVILNLAWGGDWGGSQGVDENVLPVTMEVDYVRVFQKNK